MHASSCENGALVGESARLFNALVGREHENRSFGFDRTPHWRLAGPEGHFTDYLPTRRRVALQPGVDFYFWVSYFLGILFFGYPIFWVSYFWVSYFGAVVAVRDFSWSRWPIGGYGRIAHDLDRRGRARQGGA